MTLAMWRQLAACLARLREAPDLRVLALTGAGSQAFVSGADISEFDQARDSAEAAAVYNQAVAEAQDALARFPAPTVALIQGACMGGGIGLALACDLRYASASARFRMPAARLGLGYGYADMRRVVAVTGMAAAFELFYTARTLDAEQAQAGGLLHERFALDDFERLSLARLQRIAANAPLSCGRRKRRYWHPCANRPPPNWRPSPRWCANASTAPTTPRAAAPSPKGATLFTGR